MDKSAISQTFGKPVTRADQFRAMSDVQLAIAIYDSADCLWCRNLAECGAMMDTEQAITKDKCVGCVLTWLRQPVEGKK